MRVRAGSEFFADAQEKFGVGLDGGKLGEIADDVGGSVEEKAVVGFAEHRGVVVGISGGDHLVVEAFEGGDGFLLLVGLAELVTGDVVAFHDEAVAEEGGPAKLPHEGLGKLFEGIGKDDDLDKGAEFGEKFGAAGQGPEGVDDGLDVGEFEPVAVEDLEAAGHQFVVVWFVTSGATEFRDAGFLGHGNPDFGNENAFEVEGDDGLFHGRW